jgi:hypothetical protein
MRKRLNQGTIPRLQKMNYTCGHAPIRLSLPPTTLSESRPILNLYVSFPPSSFPRLDVRFTYRDTQVEDKVWAVVMVPSAATVTLTFTPDSGTATSQTFSVNSGVTPVSMLLSESQSGLISGSIERNGQTTVQMGGQAQGGAFSWDVTPPSENFNAWVAWATSG